MDWLTEQVWVVSTLSMAESFVMAGGGEVGPQRRMKARPEAEGFLLCRQR